MNNLNSILLEGSLAADPKCVDGVCSFLLSSVRELKNRPAEITTVKVSVPQQLAEACTTLGRKDSGVRVVGRIAQERKAFVIVAEHIEFRPIQASANSAILTKGRTKA